MSKGCKFYIVCRDTRWDIYPQKEPPQVVAHDWRGFWEWDARSAQWFKTPTSFILCKEITANEAVSKLQCAR